VASFSHCWVLGCTPFDRLWFKGSGFELFLESLEVSFEVSIEGAHGFTVYACRFSSLVGVDGVVSCSQPYCITEQAVEVLEVVFGFLAGFLTKFLLHFIDVHRYASPVNEIDYLCIRSFRKLRAFAVGVFFSSSYPSCGRLSRPRTTTPFPSPLKVIGFSESVHPSPTSHQPWHSLRGFPCSTSRTRTRYCRWRVSTCPLPLSAAPQLAHGVVQVYPCYQMHSWEILRALAHTPSASMRFLAR
jgi:hypothetical protein